jgi:thiamine transporter
MISGVKRMRNSKTTILVEGAIMIALATILSYVRVYKLPWGGSITLLSMLPIALFSIKNGVKKGLEVSFLFSLVQLGQGVIDGLFGWGLTPLSLSGCIFFDYIFAFSVIGLAGMFRKKGKFGWIAGVIIALLLRFACHFTTGVIIWKTYGELWGGFSTNNIFLYSLLYNGSYMLPEIAFTTVGAFVILGIPIMRKLMLKK